MNDRQQDKVRVAIVVRVLWRAILNLMLIACLALVFAGVFELISTMHPTG